MSRQRAVGLGLSVAVAALLIWILGASDTSPEAGSIDGSSVAVNETPAVPTLAGGEPRPSLSDDSQIEEATTPPTQSVRTEAGHADWGHPDLPVIPRARTAAVLGRWREAIAMLDEALLSLPAGVTRSRAAGLRTYLLMTRGTLMEGGSALASLMADAASAMANKRYATAPDVRGLAHMRTLFSGPFMVAEPAGGWPQGGHSFALLMIGLGHGVDGRNVPHLHSEKTYFAHMTSYLERAEKAGHADPRLAKVLGAAREFAQLNLRIRTLGGQASMSKPLRAEVAAFVRSYAEIQDSRVRAYIRFFFKAYPHWAETALHRTKGD